MLGGSNPMTSVSRPRTRNQWDYHYKNLYCSEEKKNKKEEDSDKESGKSWENYGFTISGEKRSCVGNINNFGMSPSKRTRNVVYSSGSGLIIESESGSKAGECYVDLEKSTDESSVELSVSKTETTTSEDHDFSDEDYCHALSSESSGVLYHGRCDEREKDDDDKIKHERDVVIITSSDDEFMSVRKGKKSIDQKGNAGSSRIYKSHTSCNDKVDSERAKHYELGPFSKSQKKDDKYKSWRDGYSYHMTEKYTKKEYKLSKENSSRARAANLFKILVESINSVKGLQCHNKGAVLTRPTLPLRFGFEDEVVSSRVKSDWEKEIDSLFCDLELGILESEIDCTSSSVMENNEIDRSPAACCDRGEHQPILDEQTGIICKYCFTVILEMKYVLPPFYKPSPGRHERKDCYNESRSYFVDQIQLQDSCCDTRESTNRARGTVWDLIPGVEKELYPHQREGFEFMWRNIAGSIIVDEMMYPLSLGGRGCIISHAPGTGKTRLTIVFLQTFLKLFPTCRPVIIAPKGMLLTWESEFIKWNVDTPFHNLNKKELSENEHAFAARMLDKVGGSGSIRPMNVECMRLVKLASWVLGRSILGISYQLFKNLVQENEGTINGQIKKLLLESPGLLVLDEGHTPRNENSQIWKALRNVATQRRIILSGTPFQNNLAELYNTLCIVNPMFVNEIESGNRRADETRGWKARRAGRKTWTNFTSSIGLLDSDDGLKKLRAMLDPFVHVHEGNILKESLPGLRDTLVFLHPTEMQKVLLEACSKTGNIFHRIRQVSLVSVHPSLMPSTSTSTTTTTSESIDAGVKTKFVMKLIRLADALGERVLIFSQFLGPLEFIRKQIKCRFSWNEGRELLYMDGQLDERQRQDSISCFNDDRSEARVLLASERACSEGINLVGASRVVLLDTVWNPSVEKQAVSRAYRLGQKKVVYVYRLFTSGTEVRQYAQQIQKERISHLLFSPVAVDDGQTCNAQESLQGSSSEEDKILVTMLGLERFSSIFEKIIRQPKESDLIEIFGLMEEQHFK
ncbi:hypothetical protein OROGR_030326 [Orobanche gracilis]